jgi:hypothetical protein
MALEVFQIFSVIAIQDFPVVVPSNPSEDDEYENPI